MLSQEIRKIENEITSLFDIRRDKVIELSEYREVLYYRPSRRTENLVEELEFDLEEIDSKIEELTVEIENFEE